MHAHDHTFAGHVVPSVSIENLVRQREAALERLHAGLRLIWEASAIAERAGLGFPQLYQKTLGIEHSLLARKRRVDWHCVTRDADEPRIDEEAVLDRMRRAIDSGGWAHLMHESGLRTFMDFETRQQWDENVCNGKVPELTHATIQATFEAMYLNRGEMLEDGIIKCFKRLSWCYKTNLPFRFGPRIILRGFGEYNHRRCEELDDLVRVFHVLDGKPEPDHRNGMYQQIAQAYRATKTWPKHCDTDYLAIKLFKNSNAHITFKRPEVIERMNEMLARRFPGALPYDRNTG